MGEEEKSETWAKVEEAMAWIESYLVLVVSFETSIIVIDLICFYRFRILFH